MDDDNINVGVFVVGGWDGNWGPTACGSLPLNVRAALSPLVGLLRAAAAAAASAAAAAAVAAALAGGRRQAPGGRYICTSMS